MGLPRAIERSIYSTSKAAFKKALAEHGAERLCGFALYTDEGASSLIAAVNTAAHLAARSARKPKLAVAWRWSPPEWAEPAYQGPLFARLNDVLYHHQDVLAGDQRAFESFTDAFFATCVRALVALKPLVPKGINRDFVLQFDVSDYDDWGQLVAWARRLNGPKKTEPFARIMK